MSLRCAWASAAPSMAGWCAALVAACGFPDVIFDPIDDGGIPFSTEGGGLATEGGVAFLPGEGGSGEASAPGRGTAGGPSDGDGSRAGDGSVSRSGVDANGIVADAASNSSGSSGGAGSASSGAGGSGGGSGSSSSGVESASGSGGASSSSGGSDGGVMTGGPCNCPTGQSSYPSSVSSCGTVMLTNLNLLGCTSSGFTGSDPGCGNTGAFLTCTPVLSAAGLVLGCTASGPAPMVQQCH